MGPLTHTLTWFQQPTGYKKWALQPSFRKALEQEGFGPSGREQFKAFRDAEIHRLHEFVHEIGIDRKAGQTNDIKDMREYKRRWNTSKTEKTSQIVKMQREEQAHEEKMEELNERLKQQEEKFQKNETRHLRTAKGSKLELSKR